MGGRILEQDFVVGGGVSWTAVEHAEEGLEAANEAEDLERKKKKKIVNMICL